MTDQTAIRPPLVGRSSMATRALLGDLVRAAGEAGLTPAEFISGGGVAVAQDIRDGAISDVIVLADKAVRSLAADGLVLPDSVQPLFSSPSVLATRATPAPPPLTDEDDLRALLMSAEGIGYSTGPSGTAFLALIERLGLTQELSARLVQARPGNPVGAMVANGEVTLGFQQASEMTGIDGLTILGELPAPHTITSVFTGAVGASTTRLEQAQALLAFLGDQAHAPLVTQHGMSLAHPNPANTTEG